MDELERSYSGYIPDDMRSPISTQPIVERARANLNKDLMEAAIRGYSMGIFETDVKNGTVYWNDELERIFGYEPGTFDQQLTTWQAHVHPDDLAFVLDQFSAAIEQRKRSLAYSYRMHRTDGQLCFIDATVTFHYDDEGRNTKRVGANVDITHRIIQETRWRALFEEMHEGFMAGELVRNERGEPIDFKFLEVNARWETLTGVPASQAVGKRAYEIMPGLEPHWLRHHVQTVETGEPQNFVAFAAPLQRWFEVHEYCYGKDRFAAVFLDVTQRKKMEAEAEKARQRAMQASRLGVMGAMASTIAHELNQPLGAAANYLAVARLKLANGDGDKSEVEDAVACAKAAVLRAGEIIQKMREFALHGRVQSTCLRLVEVMRNAAKEAFSQPDSADTHFVEELHDSSAEILGNAVQLQQVFGNLFRNAITAMQGQDRPKQITVRSKKVRGGILVTVSDTGPGLSSDQAERVFEAFETNSVDGLGLGLALCRTIVEAHDGTIKADASFSGGRFVLQLPTPR